MSSNDSGWLMPPPAPRAATFVCQAVDVEDRLADDDGLVNNERANTDNGDNLHASNLSNLDGERGKRADARSGACRGAILSFAGEGSGSDCEPTPSGANIPEVARSHVESRPRSDADQFATHGYPPTQTRPHMRRSKPLIRKFTLSMPRSTMVLMLVDICNMLGTLDRLRYISNALASTQVDRQTDVDKWDAFTETFQKEVDTSNLLATVLLAANVGFLAIQSIDEQGLSYWPQRLSYISLFTALSSITMGLTVRMPRFFTAHSTWYLIVMNWCLSFPFALLVYSLHLFVVSLLVHLTSHAATVPMSLAITALGFLALHLTWYALLTEPEEKYLEFFRLGATSRGGKVPSTE
ncbi:hypothetical protein EDC04DRAFT_2942347 [Pisolithus marmoratus]|nr:hypothetical protein EDC04DRAFT_2942347 [Pisolithus marmoratus]